MSEWREVALGDAIELKRGYDLPSAERRLGSVPIISSSGESGFHSEAKVKGPGVVTGRYGTIGEVFFVEPDFWPLNTSLYVRDFKGNDVRFVYYLLKTIKWSQFNDKSGVPGVNRNHVHEARVRLPEMGEQAAIAHILGSLDNKIKRNGLLNQTLQTMARTLFKEWFVDFGHVRAKLHGRVPATLSPEDAALFPSSFADSGLPTGWQSEPLLQHARLISGGTPKTSVEEYWDGPILWASAKDVSQCSEAFLIATERSITKRGLDESSTKLVPSLATAVVARGATTGRFCMFGREMAMNQTCYALQSLANRPFWLNCAFHSVVDGLVNSAHGSVFDTITTRTFEGAKVVFPGERLLQSFEETVRPLFERLLASIEESTNLAEIRDYLLPRLVSGAIRIKDVERQLGDVV